MLIFDIFVNDMGKTLSVIPYDLIGVEHKKQPIKDSEGNTTSETEPYSSYLVEIPKGHGKLSRKQITVKVVEDSSLILDEDQLNDGRYQITFSDLSVSYVDSQRRTIYLRATKYEILDTETGKVVGSRA